MGHTFTNNLYHIVFSTKSRQPYLLPAFRERIFKYMYGVAVNKSGTPLAINGIEDHVHILAAIKPDMPVSKFVGDVKANASRWISDTFPEVRDFTWQSGYSSFTVSESKRDEVFTYIANQQEHHKDKSFADELAFLLKKNKIAFDPHDYLG